MVLGIWGGRLAGSMATLFPDTFDRGLLEFLFPTMFFCAHKIYVFSLLFPASGFYGYYVKEEH
jgi:hypothetical protein